MDFEHASPPEQEDQAQQEVPTETPLDAEPSAPVEQSRTGNPAQTEAPARVTNPALSAPVEQKTPAADGRSLNPQVLEHALALFDGMQAVHALCPKSREILKEAFELEGAHLPGSKKKFYPAALALVHAQAGLDLDEESERVLVALLGLRQEKLAPKELAGAGLSAQEQRQALTLAALLGIAEGLDHTGSGTRIRAVEPGEAGVVVVVEGPLAAKDARTAGRKSRPWGELGYPELQILEPDEAELWLMPFPAPTETSGILPGDTLAEAGRKTMRFLFAQMLNHEEGTRQGQDIEALHDMRVATRRLRAAFEVFGQAFEPGVLKPHLKGLRATGRALGAVRDLDVFMEKARGYIRSLPEERRGGLDPLLGHWQAQREEARRRMLVHLNSPGYARFKRDFNIFLNTPLAGKRPQPEDQVTPRLVRQVVPMLVYERMASVRAYETWLQDAPIERLHMLRIEIKKLRYTLEYFREVMGKRTAEAIENLKLLQDHLGDLNDAQVAAQILGEFIETYEAEAQALPIHERQSIEEVVSYLAYRHSERHRLLVTFGTAWKTHFQNKTFRRSVAQAIAVL